MKWIDAIDNIFLLDKGINKEQIFKILLAVVSVPVFKFFLKNEIIDLNSLIIGSLYVLSTSSIIPIFKNRKILNCSFKRFFVFNMSLFVRTILVISIFISIIYVSKWAPYGFIGGLFWLFSSLLRALLTTTKAIFLLNTEDYLKIIQIFAYARISYYGIIMIVYYDFFISSPLFELLFALPLFFFAGYFITNLYPHMTKHTNVKNTLELIRIVKNEKKIKFNNLKKLTNFSSNDYDKMIDRLASINYLERNNKRIELGKNLKF